MIRPIRLCIKFYATSPKRKTIISNPGGLIYWRGGRKFLGFSSRIVTKSQKSKLNVVATENWQKES